MTPQPTPTGWTQDRIDRVIERVKRMSPESYEHLFGPEPAQPEAEDRRREVEAITMRIADRAFRGKSYADLDDALVKLIERREGEAVHEYNLWFAREQLEAREGSAR